MAVEYGDRYSVQQSIIEDEQTKARNAITDAVNLAATKGAGMMYEAVSRGEREGQFYADLGNMLTGQGRPVDPRLARQDALEAIFNRHGHPDSYEDMVAIANDLRASGFPGEADLAMTQANAYQQTETNRLNAEKTASQSTFAEKLAIWDNSTAERRKELTEAGFFGEATTTIILGEGEEAYQKKLGDLMAEKDIALIESIGPAMGTLENTNEVLKLLDDEGVTTGFGATMFTNAKRMGNTLMRVLNKDHLVKEDVSKDQYLEALLGSQVFAMIKTLGIGARGLDTPAERDFLISVMTGVRTMDAGAIKRLTRLRQEIAIEAIQKYNEKIDNGSLYNYIMLERKIPDDGSEESKARLELARIEMKQELPEIYQTTWKRPAEGVRPVLLDGKETGYFSWDGRYYDSENREISIDDLNALLNSEGGQ